MKKREDKKPTCLTYLSVDFPIDHEKNVALLQKGKEGSLEELGIDPSAKEEVERALRARTDSVLWDYHHFEVGRNECYDIDVNRMLRVTLKGLFQNARALKQLAEKYHLSLFLTVVPTLVAGSEEPSQYLSLERDIVEFLYFSGAKLDFDYYVI